jgi:hypothetical protein
MLHKYIHLQKEADGGLAKDDADRPIIRQAVRNVYTNCTNPNFNSSGVDTASGINNLTVDSHGHERDWITLPNRKEHFGDLQRMVDNDLYDILLQKIKVPSLQTVMHSKQQSSWAPGPACIRLLNTAYGIQPESGDDTIYARNHVVH